MTWKEYKPKKKKYDGINVNATIIHICISMSREFKSKGVLNIKIAFDVSKGLIKFTKLKKKTETSFLIDWGMVSAKLSDDMPRGRYNLYSKNEKEYIFKKTKI